MIARKRDRRRPRGRVPAPGSTATHSSDRSPIAACMTEPWDAWRTRRRPSEPPSTRATASSATCRRPTTARPWCSTTRSSTAWSRPPARSPPTRRRCSPASATRGRTQKILTFAQFLDLVDGRVPLLVEVKGKKAGADAAFLEKIARQARAYEGPIALMSFDRAIVAALGERAPTIPRGAIVGGQQLLASLWAGSEQDARKRRGLARVRIGTRQRRLLRRRREAGGGGAKVDVAPRAGSAAVHLDRANAAAAGAAARWADAPIFEGYEA